jgi:hypothetical protein
MKAASIIGAVEGVTKKWTTQRKREEKEASARLNRSFVMVRRRVITVRKAAWQIMEKAYLKASANGTLPAHARQVMYAARPYIQQTAAGTHNPSLPSGEPHQREAAAPAYRGEGRLATGETAPW